MDRLTVNDSFEVFMLRKSVTAIPYCATVREYFRCGDNQIVRQYISFADFHRMIGDGYVFVPINDKPYWDEVAPHEAVGLKVVFVRASLFRDVRRLYYKEFL